MTWRLLRWTCGIVVAGLILFSIAIAWLVATEGGTRWLLAQASPRLPGALHIEEVRGTLIRGLNLRAVSWKDAAATVSVVELDAGFELMPLLKREVRINNLGIRDVDVVIADGAESNKDAEPFSIDLPVTLRIETASITEARLSTDDQEITIDEVRLGGELSGSLLRIDNFDVFSELGDFSLSGYADLAGTYAANATGAWELRPPDQPPLSGILELRGDTSRYEVAHDLDAPYAIESRGTLVLVASKLSLDLVNTWQRVHVEAGEAPAADFLDGILRISGPVDEIAFDGTTTVVSDDIPPVVVEMHGRFAGDRIHLASLSAANDWGRLKADGEIVLSGEPSWNFDVELSELDPAIADQRLTGTLNVVATTAGRLVEQLPSLDLKIESISGDLNGNPVDGSVAMSFADEQLRFDSGVVRVGDNRVNFDGSYGQELQVDAKVGFSDMAQFELGLAGVLNGDVLLASDLQTFQASGDVSGRNLAWNDYFLDTIEAEFDLPAANDGSIVFRASSAEHGSVATEIEGRFVDQQWSGSVRKLTLHREPIGEWTLRDAADFSLSQTRFSLEKACLGTISVGSIACVAADYDSSGPLQFRAIIDALPIAALPRNLPEGTRVLGEINAEASGQFADGRLNSNVNLQIDRLGMVVTFEGDEVSTMFEKAEASASIVDNKLVGEFEFKVGNTTDHATGRIEIADLFDQRSALLGQGSMEFRDLALLSFFVPDLANPIGKISGRIDTSGSLMAPEIVGEVGLSDGSVDIRRAGISVTEIDLLLRQNKAGELALKGNAKSGNGSLRISGETRFGAATGIETEVRLDGENFGLIRMPDWQVTASPTIVVLFDERATHVSGELGIPEANITVKTVPETTRKPSPDAVVHRGDDSSMRPQRLLLVDVTTNLGEQVFFSGFGLTTGLDGSVRISGDSQSPYQGFGRVVLREGRYKAYGQNLEIESGELVFNGPLSNPALDVRATRTASDKTVAGIHLTGTPAQLRSEVYSEPALGDAEALSYLLTGRPLNSANSEQGDMLNQAAFALGLTTAGSVTSRIRNQLGLETLGIEGGAESQQLVAGKRFGDRLFVEYAYGVVDSLGTLLLRYQLSRRLMVESRSGSVRIVDVVYSVKKK